MEDYEINISVKKFKYLLCRTAEMVSFHFSYYKSMGTISCHSNQSYVTGIKKALYVEANVINMYAKYQLYPPNSF